MKRSLFIVVALLLGLSGALVFGKSQTAKAAGVGDKPAPVDIGPELRTENPKKVDVNESALPYRSSLVAPSSEPYEPVPGTVRYFLALDDVKGYYFKKFTLKAISEHGEIWVANDLAFPQESRNDAIKITQEQIDYLLSEFEHNIYPKDTAFFGMPDKHTGENPASVIVNTFGKNYYQAADGSHRNIILVDNIRDRNYYNPDFPSYIAGFYSPTMEFYTDRNVITIDAYDWANRLGPNAKHPHLYEGTVAHEYQHLIHDDNDSNEKTWINEGMSDFAEYLVGYGHPQSHIQAFAQKPENALVAWEDQGAREILADYGNAYLFQLYLNDHFGGQPFIQALAKNEKSGIAGVNDTLQAFEYNKTFTNIYRNYQTALVIDAGGKYGFESIDFTVNTSTKEAYASAGAPAWGSDFIELNSEEEASLYFDGIDYKPTSWKVVEDPKHPGDKVLWSGKGSLANRFLIKSIDLTKAREATLTFDTYFEIEKSWDYGFVQVSTDGGKTWTSLANKHTSQEVVPNAHPTIKNNVPGFTGSSEGWTTQTFDLSQYAGQKILIGFRYVTDWATEKAGWYIDDIEVQAAGFSSNGSTTKPFKSLDEVLKNEVDYLVSLIEIEQEEDETEYEVQHLKPFNMTDEGTRQLAEEIESDDEENVIMTVTYGAPAGDSSYVDYTYDLRGEDEEEDDWDEEEEDDDEDDEEEDD